MRSRVVLAMMLAWLNSVAAANAQVWLPKSLDETMTLDLDNAATKRLASVEDHAAEKQWDVVANLLRQAQAEQGDKLVAIAPGWYVSVRRYCQCRAALLPPAGLAAYRTLTDGAANAWVNEARRSDDRADWLRIARNGFASSHGFEAVRRLAEQSFEAGDFAAARMWWELLLPAEAGLRSVAGVGLLRQPSDAATTSREADIRAALILCSLLEGDVSRAERELAAFRQRHGERQGRIGRRDGVLSDLLSEELSRARYVRSTSADTESPMIDGPIWTQRIPSPKWEESIWRSGRDSSDSFWPVVAANKVFASNGEAIVGWELSDGRAAWSAAHSGNPTSPTDAVEANRSIAGATVYSVANATPSKLAIEGQVLQTLTVSDDRLYARMGLPITGCARQETTAASELIGIDLGRGEGKLVWRIAAEEFDPRDPLQQSSPWCFDGTPVVKGNRVWAVLRRSLPQEEILVACFDADTARVRWKRKLGVTISATPETVNSTSHLQPTLSEDSVFVSTDEGAIAALDQIDGSIRWLRTIVAMAGANSERRRRFGFTPPLAHRGVLYVAPLNGQELLAIHAESGLRLWQHTWPDPIQFILGIRDDTLIVSGRSIWGVRLSDGLPAWPLRRVGDDDPEGWSVGRGALIGRHIVWPLRDELLVIAASSGQIERRMAFRQSLGTLGGDVCISGSHLLISRDRQITAWRLSGEERAAPSR